MPSSAKLHGSQCLRAIQAIGKARAEPRLNRWPRSVAVRRKRAGLLQQPCAVVQAVYLALAGNDVVVHLIE